MTVEDPVEYEFPTIRQTQVRPRAGLTFATAIRSLLRQDPDVIMIGEIRDPETAQLAVRAALSGVLVFSHPAHAGLGGRRAASHGHGRRTVPARVHDGGRRRAAAGPPRLPPVQGARRRTRPTRWPRSASLRPTALPFVQGRRVRGVRPDGLPGPHGRLRDPHDRRRDARPHRRARRLAPHPGGRGARAASSRCATMRCRRRCWARRRWTK